jgi:putative thioredoxin
MSFQIHDRAHHDAAGEQCIFDTDTHHYEEDVIAASHDRLVLVDLWADWCGPCHHLAPVLARVVPGYDGRVRLAKVEVDAGDNMKIAGRNGARGFPTVLLYRNGEVVDRFHGAKPEHFVREFIERHLD